MKKEIQQTRLNVFIQDARLLTEDELDRLPQEKRDAVSGKPGLWIQVSCPEGACSMDGGNISLPAAGVIPRESKGIWLSLFCPENQCEIKRSIDLP